MIKKIKGIIPPMLTPLTADYDLDVSGVKNLTGHLIDGGVHGIFILGTTGESTSLSYKVREELIWETAKSVQGKIPVFVGITDTCLRESLRLAIIAHKSGAEAVVCAPPYYFHMGQEELFEYYWDLADKLPIPLFLYNMPSLTKIHVDTKTVVKLAEHPNVIGLKDSSANTVYFQSLLHAIKREDFRLLVGPEEIMSETVLMGGDGGVNGGANLFPRLYVELYQASIDRDFQKIELLQKQVMEVGTMLYKVGKYGSSYLKGLKGTASLLGLCSPYLAPPLKQFRKKEMKMISNNLEIVRENIEKLRFTSQTNSS